MIIPHYVRSIREGIELAGVDTNFVLLSERYLYGDYLFENGRRVFQDVYIKPISPEFDEGSFNFKARLDDKEKEILNLPPEFDPIVLLTKSSTVKIVQSIFRYGEIKKQLLEYTKRLSPEQFGKILVVQAFHEACHRKYEVKAFVNEDIEVVKRDLQKCGLSKDVIEILQESDLSDYNPEFGHYLPNILIRQELPVVIDQLKLAKRRPDLEPYIKVLFDNVLEPNVIRTIQLAKRLIGG